MSVGASVQVTPGVVPLPAGVMCWDIFEGFGFDMSQLNQAQRKVFEDDLGKASSFNQINPGSAIIRAKFENVGIIPLSHGPAASIQMGITLTSYLNSMPFLNRFLVGMWKEIRPLREFCYMHILRGPLSPQAFHDEIQHAIDRAAASGYIITDFVPSMVTPEFLNQSLGHIAGDQFVQNLAEQIEMLRSPTHAKRTRILRDPSRHWFPAECKVVSDALDTVIRKQSINQSGYNYVVDQLNTHARLYNMVPRTSSSIYHRLFNMLRRPTTKDPRFGGHDMGPLLHIAGDQARKGLKNRTPIGSLAYIDSLVDDLVGGTSTMSTGQPSAIGLPTTAAQSAHLDSLADALIGDNVAGDTDEDDPPTGIVEPTPPDETPVEPPEDMDIPVDPEEDSDPLVMLHSFLETHEIPNGIHAGCLHVLNRQVVFKTLAGQDIPLEDLKWDSPHMTMATNDLAAFWKGIQDYVKARETRARVIKATWNQILKKGAAK